YNLNPQEGYNLDDAGQNILVDLVIDSQLRNALVKTAANGFFYVFDRVTGQILNQPWMHAYNHFANGVDLQTGRLLYSVDKLVFSNAADRARYTNATGTEVAWCPGSGARDWTNDAYSPLTGLVYTVANSSCGAHSATQGDFAAGQDYT